MLSLLLERSLKLTLQVKRYSNPNINMGKKRDFEEGSEGEEERVEVRSKPRHKRKHDKPKPWDDESIDHWKVEKFDPAWNEGGMLEVSSFSTLFPQYREKYLQDVWPSVRGALKQHGISCELNLEGDYAWHLGVMASFFVLLKLLGPYYPYWFRMLIPHFSNGGLLRIAWLAFLLYRRPKEALQTTETSASDH